MPATVLAEHVGWSRSPPWFRKSVADDWISFASGDQARCDLWCTQVRIRVGTGKPRVLPKLAMLSSHSRSIRARMFPLYERGPAGRYAEATRGPLRGSAADLGQRNQHWAAEQLRQWLRSIRRVLATMIVQVKPTAQNQGLT